METILLVSIGGACGGITRFIVGRYADNGIFPVGTFIVNVFGSFLLGLVLFASGSSQLISLIGIGYCGALTTFSSFSYQTLELWEEGRDGAVLLHAFGTLVAALSGFSLAWLVFG